MQIYEIVGLILALLMLEIVTHLSLCNFLGQSFYTPKTIYEKTDMNWFGTIVVYILIFPFSFILGIGGFLRWLFTVGRK